MYIISVGITKGRQSSGQTFKDNAVFSGQHRGLGSSLSKVRSLKMDNKVWTEPLIQVGVKRLMQEATVRTACEPIQESPK